MLAEVVGPKELLRLITLCKLVDMTQMLCSLLPMWWVGKFLPAISAYISATGGRSIESRFDAEERRT